MASGIKQVLATDRVVAADRAHATAQPDQLPPMTAEAARRLAVVLAPHLLAMRAVTAGTQYGACVGADPAASDPAAGGAAATNTAATSTAASAQLPPASAATTIFIAGMLERISA